MSKEQAEQLKSDDLKDINIEAKIESKLDDNVKYLCCLPLKVWNYIGFISNILSFISVMMLMILSRTYTFGMTTFVVIMFMFRCYIGVIGYGCYNAVKHYDSNKNDANLWKLSGYVMGNLLLWLACDIIYIMYFNFVFGSEPDNAPKSAVIGSNVIFAITILLCFQGGYKHIQWIKRITKITLYQFIF